MNDPEVLILLLIAIVFALGMLTGLSASHVPHTTRRIRLRALEAYEGSNTLDPTVASILRRDIRRLQASLRVDEDED